MTCLMKMILMSRLHWYIPHNIWSFVLLFLYSLCFLKGKIFFINLLEQFWRYIMVSHGLVVTSAWRFDFFLYWLRNFEFLLFLIKCMQTCLFQRNFALFSNINFLLFLRLVIITNSTSERYFLDRFFKSFLQWTFSYHLLNFSFSNSSISSCWINRLWFSSFF